MSFLGYNKLKKVLASSIDPFDASVFEKSKSKTSYELTLGDEVYLTNSDTGKKEILDGNNSEVHIDPGQFALLITKEKVTVPKDKIAFISLKFGIKVKGLINISGFHVDSGFTGKLVYSVYNSGTRTVILKKGEPYFPIWFCEMGGDIGEGIVPYDGDHQNQDCIRTEYIENLKGELWNPIKLADRISETEKKLSDKIKDVESLKRNQIYVLGIIATALVGISINLFWSDKSYKNGYINGVSDKQAIERIDNIISSKNLDSLLNVKADLILKSKSDNIKH